ncbi:NAD(P)/FAD-dependent oxidoreductase [Microvirga yunnanensis]|uniref:NAD(P)/FAD-dependent oxidoreductase n=1 Tax=Microvirga yunnanensis TaxID=2953740 RepID=UPI0021C6CD7B|nr:MULTISPECIES: FAD-dependent oxidoreductase [unclassified Microvirga]
MANIAIVGAGIIGVASAAFLQRDGHSVTLYDPLRPGEGCSFGNAGSIGPGSVVPLSTPGIVRQAASWVTDPNSPLWIDWRYLPRALPWLAKFIAAGASPRIDGIAKALRLLHADSFKHYRTLLGVDGHALLHVSGQLYLYESDAAFAKDALGRRLRDALGIRSEILSSDEIRQLEPSLGPRFARALYLPDSGHCSDPHRLVATIAEDITRNGGRFVRAAVKDFEQEAGQVRAVITDAGRMPCDTVVVAAGAWSQRLARRLGLRIPLESLRGYHVMLPMPETAPKRPLYPLAAKIMITPMEHGLRIAGTAEIAGLDAPMNERRAAALGTIAKRYFPGIAGEPISVWMGHRPATPDSLPVIGPSPQHRNVMLAFGHGQTGLIGGSTTGLLVSDLVAGREPTIDPYPYRVGRF